jgi:hypothetical protein
MPELLVHPFFTSCLPKPTIVRILNPAEIAKTVARASDIDLDLFDNLRTLRNDAPNQQLIRKLINSERGRRPSIIFWSSIVLGGWKTMTKRKESPTAPQMGTTSETLSAQLLLFKAPTLLVRPPLLLGF